MFRRARRSILIAGLTIFLANFAAAQSLIRPTPAPLVTAENETWYLNGEPITYAGTLYYPGGAAVFFNPNEMVRSGFFMGVPLYTRTTLEPFSVVYVPVGGGRMQPYERPRAGDLAGTAGSQPLSLRTPYQTDLPDNVLPQAAAAPTRSASIEVDRGASAPVRDDRPVGTSGYVPPVPVTRAAPRVPTHTRIGGRPQGINALFVEFGGERWYSTSRSVGIDTTRLRTIGDYHGFDVWADPSDKTRIYLPATRAGSTAVEYTRQKPR